MLLLVASVVQEPSFAFKLDGRNQVIDATMSILLSDTRPEKSGWHLRIAAVHIVDPNTGRSLHNATLTIPAVTVECVQPSCLLPVDTVRGAMVAFRPFATETVKFLNAMPESGAGELIVTPTLRLHVPADAYVGDYRISVVVTVVSGP